MDAVSAIRASFVPRILRDAFPLLRFVGDVDKWRQRWQVGDTGSSRDDGDAVSASLYQLEFASRTVCKGRKRIERIVSSASSEEPLVVSP